MNSRSIVGAVLLVVGIVLFVIGMNSSESVVDQVNKTFTGRFTEATTWYIVGGIASGVLGGLLLAVGLRGKNS